MAVAEKWWVVLLGDSALTPTGELAKDRLDTYPPKQDAGTANSGLWHWGGLDDPFELCCPAVLHGINVPFPATVQVP